jgi:mRNA interferase YafQ
MYSPDYSSQFARDVKKLQKKHRDFKEFKTVIDKILNGETLPKKYDDHWLSGDWAGIKECHISFDPDWLLIYRQKGEKVFFYRTGSHDDVF